MSEGTPQHGGGGGGGGGGRGRTGGQRRGGRGRPRGRGGGGGGKGRGGNNNSNNNSSNNSNEGSDGGRTGGGGGGKKNNNIPSNNNDNNNNNNNTASNNNNNNNNNKGNRNNRGPKDPDGNNKNTNNSNKGNNNNNSNNNNSNKGRRRNNKHKGPSSTGSTTSTEPAMSGEEKIRLEEQKAHAEAAAAEKKRLEEEQKAAEEAREARRKAKQELEQDFREACDYLKKNVVEIATTHKDNRMELHPETLLQARKSFEATKKTLKSDLKKCTTFVKKIKSGSAWSMQPEDIARDVATLNLSRYVEEVVAALLEAKLKLGDMPVVMSLCKAMHVRYSEFIPNLLPALWAVIHGKPTEETSKLRRVYVRLITEFLLSGLLSETKALVKLVAEATGGKDGSYAVTDANIVVAFAKAAGFEIFAITPQSVRKFSDFIQRQVDRQKEQEKTTMEATKVAQDKEEAKTGPEEVDNKDEKKPQVQAAANDDNETMVVVSSTLAKKGMDLVQQVQELLVQRAVPPEISQQLATHCEGAHRTLSNSLVSTHGKLQKLEKRCEQDRLLSGSLTEVREKGLVDARKLLDSLQKSVEALSDVLDLPVPKLEEAQNEEAEGGGVGLELWTKGGSELDGGADYGPFDDEETRAFYSDIPDLLTTVPPALLGMSSEEIEKRKAENLAKYGTGFEGGSDEVDNDAVEVAPSSEAQLEAAEKEATLGSTNQEGDEEEAKQENKDTPHYRLMVLLEQELPECNRREQIDAISEKFCTNNGSTKNSRKRLIQTLFLVPRTRLDLLPYYSRMAATLCRVWPDISTSLVTDLEQQFHGQAKYKKNQNMESRLRTARYIGELTKFRVAPPIIAFRCLRRCLDDFTGGNVDVACCLLESCGRYLYRLQHTNAKLTNLMEAMMRIGKAKHLDERSQALINTAFYTVKPPASGPKKQAKVYPVLEGYLRHMFMVRLQPTESSVAFVAKQLIRFPWSDPSKQCGMLVCKCMLKTCRKGRYKAIQAIAAVAAKLRRHKPEVCIRLIDAVLEELQWAMEYPAFKDQQRTLTYARLLGELYCASLASGQLIVQQLYKFINFGHDIPDALRDASEKHVAASDATNDGQADLPALNSATGVSQVIHEGEEMDEQNLEPKEQSLADSQPVAVSRFSKFDPRVPTPLDLPNSVFRIKLVCTLLEVVAKAIVTRNNIAKIEGFLAAFQRYLFTKTMLPTEVEFSLLDTFDIIDSQWRKVMKELSGKQRKTDASVDKSQGFPRYATWLEAHNATIAVEEAEAMFESRAKSRLEVLAGKSKAEDGDETVVSDLLHEEDDLMDVDDDSTEDPLSASAKDSLAEDHESDDLITDDEPDDATNDEEESQSEESEEEEESEEDEMDDDSEDDEGSDEEFDEQAYMRQLEEEAFERELRRLTMDALEKGKVAARGGKVADNMPSGSQFIKKKEPNMMPAETGPAMALGGKEGISFQLLKKGNKGKLEAKQFFVPTDTNLALVATKQDDEAARERDMIKARVLQYEAESAESHHSGGNVYLELEKLQVIRNRPLSMEEIDRNFGTTGGNLRQTAAGGGRSGPNVGSGGVRGGPLTGGRAGPLGTGRGGRGGRGRGNVSGRSLV